MALKALVRALRAAWPRLQITVETQVAEGDLVATRWTARGLGPDDGTSAPRTAAGLTLARLAGGKIVEDWTSWDVRRETPRDAAQAKESER